ncbi:MAG: hypothetical protein CM15mV42_1980 [uncultured marine virus]|nr:MAG: hypothetical protein CM15mV42_1980 [uncultured marine virus]
MKKKGQQLAGLFSTKDEDKDYQFPKSLMKFERDKLFRGHRGEVWVHNESLTIRNTYFNSECTQTVHTNDNLVKITVHTYHKNPKWLSSFLTHIENELGLSHNNIKLVLESDKYTYTVGNYNTSTKYKELAELICMYNHYDAIKVIKAMSGGMPLLLKNIRSCNREYLLDMIKGMNPDYDQHTSKFKIDRTLLN